MISVILVCCYDDVALLWLPVQEYAAEHRLAQQQKEMEERPWLARRMQEEQERRQQEQQQ
jgi:hypothetical protein